MTALEFLAEPMWQTLAFVLLHFTWQGLLVAVLTAVGVRLFGLRSVDVRHRCYLAGLLAMTACPLVTFFVLGVPATARPTVVQIEPIALPAIVSDEQDHANAPQFAQEETSVSGTVSLTAEEAAVADLPITSRPTLAGWQFYLLLAWLAGVCCFGGRMLVGHVVIWRLRRDGIPLSDDLLAAAKRLSQELGMSRMPGMAVSKRLGNALAMGVLRPLILLPSSWLMELPPDVLEAVIAHELAHIHRRDLWINLLARSVEALLFYHPAVWWMTGELRRERELCCDELAVSVTGRRADYARALEFVARNNVMGRQPVLATGMGEKKMALLDRVRHVLGLRGVDRRTGWWSAGMVALAVPVLFWVASSAMRPAVADDERRDGDRAEIGEREERERREVNERERDERREAGERERGGDRRERSERERLERLEKLGLINRGRRGGDRERPERDASRAELLEIISKLRREMAEMRRHMHGRGQVHGPRWEGDRPRVEIRIEKRIHANRRDGDGPPRRGPRDGEGPPKRGPRDGDRPPKKGPREGVRPPLRDRDLPRVARPLEGRPPSRRGDRVDDAEPRPERLPLAPVLNLIRELRGEIEKLRRDVNELRGDRKPRPARKPRREEATDDAAAEETKAAPEEEAGEAEE